MKPIIDGILAGAGGTIASKYVGQYGQSLASLGVGYFRNNATLKTVGAIQLGAAIAGQFFGGGNGNGTGVYN